jgi:hypothetical protein
MVTIEGITWSATVETWQALADPDPELAPELEVADTITPPITPPTTSATPRAAQRRQRRVGCSWAESVTCPLLCACDATATVDTGSVVS